ncbi:MAG TPA: hypothetical protein VFR36_04665 [Sphingomicrobium sp.]|nr:hypothetical protein [Sphingomicrobium sp.]
MFEFLWHLRGSTPLEGTATNAEVLDGLERMLGRQRKPIAERNTNIVTFDAPLWEDLLGGNWRAMVIYDYGRFWIDHDLSGRILRYDLRSLHGFVFCLFAAAMFFAFGSADGAIIDGFKFAALAFGWLYGMNLLLALIRVPPLIRKAVREA